MLLHQGSYSLRGGIQGNLQAERKETHDTDSAARKEGKGRLDLCSQKHGPVSEFAFVLIFSTVHALALEEELSSLRPRKPHTFSIQVAVATVYKSVAGPNE
jgi:hypothetical protein